jgi:hypothetical protein
MLLYRLSTKEWQDDLSGESGKAVSGLWTIEGNHCIYAHSSVANCLVENRMFQTLLGEINTDMVMVEYEVPDNSLQVFEEKQLPEEWRNDEKPSIARYFGTLRLQEGKTLLMAFPSVVMTHKQLIYIINPLHPLMKEVRITDIFNPLH